MPNPHKKLVSDEAETPENKGEEWLGIFERLWQFSWNIYDEKCQPEYEEMVSFVKDTINNSLLSQKKAFIEKVEGMKHCEFESDGEKHTCWECVDGHLENCKKCFKDRCTNVLCPKGVRENEQGLKGFNEACDQVLQELKK